MMNKILMTAILMFILFAIIPRANHKEVGRSVELIHVVDGDTIKIILDGDLETVRLLDIDAPESNTLRYGYAQSGGKESTKCLEDLIAGQPMQIVSDGEYDKYGRLLAYVYIGKTNINKEMVRLGCAKRF